jgi:hypothetical protein
MSPKRVGATRTDSATSHLPAEHICGNGRARGRNRSASRRRSSPRLNRQLTNDQVREAMQSGENRPDQGSAPTCAFCADLYGALTRRWDAPSTIPNMSSPTVPKNRIRPLMATQGVHSLSPARSSW